MIPRLSLAAAVVFAIFALAALQFGYQGAALVFMIAAVAATLVIQAWGSLAGHSQFEDYLEENPKLATMWRRGQRVERVGQVLIIAGLIYLIVTRLFVWLPGSLAAISLVPGGIMIFWSDFQFRMLRLKYQLDRLHDD